MHDLLPEHLCPAFFNVKPSEDFSFVLNRLEEHTINFPLIVKPEVGGQGILFRKIDTEEQLKNYHAQIPVEYFVQQLIRISLRSKSFLLPLSK